MSKQLGNGIHAHGEYGYNRLFWGTKRINRIFDPAMERLGRATFPGGVSDPFLAPSYIVIYDPKGGYVAGSVTIASPSGAYVANPSLTGPATFGFTSKYSTSTGKKTSTTPVGTTAFQFKLGNLDFRSTNYYWMVVSGPKVIYKGTGTINKKGTYMFILNSEKMITTMFLPCP